MTLQSIPSSASLITSPIFTDFQYRQNEMYDIFQRLEALVPDLRDALLHFGAGSALEFGKAVSNSTIHFNVAHCP
jgi:hypothetical protein